MTDQRNDDPILVMATYFVDTHLLKVGRGIDHDPALRYELIQWKAHQIADLFNDLINNLEQYSA